MPKTLDGTIALVALIVFAAWLFIGLPLLYSPSQDHGVGRMTVDQYVSSGASVAAFLAAFATFLTVWQIAKQRKATYRPDIAIMRARIITAGKMDNESIAPLLKWRRSDEETDRNGSLGNDYPLLLVNIGMGAATSVLTKWEFPMESFISETRRFRENEGYQRK